MVIKLTDIYTTCLSQNPFSDIWELEHVRPIKKKISDLQKIALSSDFKKFWKDFIKDCIEDIKQNIDQSQYGARNGSETEHLIAAFVDRVLKILTM